MQMCNIPIKIYKNKNKYRSILIIFFIIILTYTPNIRAIIFGSNSAVSNQSTVNFPAADANNEMRGFASFNQGATLSDSSAACIFNSLFPIAGPLTLNGGLLTLQQDLVLQGESPITNVGTIDANGYSMRFTTSQDMVLPATGGGGLSTIAVIEFITSANVGATVNSVDFSYDNSYVAVSRITSTGNELYVYSFNGTSLSLVGGVDFANDAYAVRWHPSQYRFAFGKDAGGDNNLRIYDIVSNSLVEKSGVALPSGLDGRALAWRPDGDYIAVGTSNSASNGATNAYVYSVSSGGILAQVGSYAFSGSSRVSFNALYWNGDGTYFVIGCFLARSFHELRVFSFNGSTLSSNASLDVAQTISAVAWHPTLPVIAIGLSDGTQRLRIYEHSSGSLVEKTAARVGESYSVYGLDWSPDGASLLMGRQANGSGTELRTYSYNSEAYTLTLENQLDFASDINDVRWSKDKQYGVIGTSSNDVRIYRLSSTTQASISALTLKNSCISFESNILLAKPLRLQGTCIIDGHDHTMALSATNSLLIDSGASVLLENMTLSGVSNGLIQCLDSVATLSLRNVIVQFDNSYSFTQGRLDIVGDVLMTGTQIITYQSPSISTINSYGRLTLDQGMTFSYAAPSTNRNLLAFTDSTSQLRLNGVTLCSTRTGLQFKKGTIIIEDTCSINSDATVQAEAIEFGDGVSSANDTTIKLLPGSGITVVRGICSYKNTA